MAKLLRILFVVHNQTRKGGAYYRGLGLGASMARRGHEVRLMAIHPSEHWRVVERELDGINLVETPDLLWGTGRTGWDPWDTFRRVAWIRQRKFDVIHTVDTRPAVSIPALLGRKASGAVWIADWTDWWSRGGATEERSGWVTRSLVGPLEQLFEERPRVHADGTVVISRALGERARGLGVGHTRMLCLPPGAEPRSIRETTREEARRRFGLASDGHYIGYLGNIYQRDADLLFHAMELLRVSEAKLIMVGEPGCKVPRELGGRVVVTGRLPLEGMLGYLSCCDVLALPLSDTIANRGRWPSKINEYVAVGRPTVACDVGDVADLLRENEIGLLVKPTPDGLAAGLDELLSDLRRAQAMGDCARHIARSTYSYDVVAAKLEHFYQEILEAVSRRH